MTVGQIEITGGVISMLTLMLKVFYGFGIVSSNRYDDD